MPNDVSNELRQLIATRARFCCEYCLMPQSASLQKHEPDHIVPRQHGGTTEEKNLALSCWRCNRNKGPNAGSFDPDSGLLVPFFNPRVQAWGSHFKFEGALIVPITAEGRVTVRILRLNDADRITERQNLMEAGLYDSSTRI